MKNEMTLAFDSISENEAFARVAVAAFVTQLNPTLEEVADIKTAVSEAVTNAIIHALIQEKVIYRNLGLVVTDEQHRFGVKQREMLAEKGRMPHLLW